MSEETAPKNRTIKAFYLAVRTTNDEKYKSDAFEIVSDLKSTTKPDAVAEAAEILSADKDASGSYVVIGELEVLNVVVPEPKRTVTVG